MLDLSRANRGALGYWWWTVDHWILLGIFLLIASGALLVLSASPAVADQHTWTSFYFVKRHLTFVAPCLLILMGVSFLTLQQIRFLALSLVIGGYFLLILTLFWGTEIKGARRWLGIGGISVQPSEFVKPGLAILWGWIFSQGQHKKSILGEWIGLFLYLLAMVLLLLQPDVGMSILITLVWLSQFFVAGMPLLWLSSLGISGIFGLGCAYWFLPHVQRRIDSFLIPGLADKFGDHFQVLKSLGAFTNGGLWGRGPGEGIIKRHLPDAHADFIFAVAGEEFGFVFCSFIILVYGFIILRCVLKVLKSHDMFIVLSATGLIVQFGLQVLINIASALHLIPPKGMTLPFISYGGSSFVALSIGMGMLLGLTRRRVKGEGD